MPSPFTHAVGAGIISAVTFISVALGNPTAGVLLFVFVPLPILLAGLGLGWHASIVAGATATILVLLAGGMPVGTAFAAGHIAPAILLSRLALTDRTDPATNAIEWYPPGRLVIAAALLGTLLAVALVLSLGGTHEAMKGALGPQLEQVLKDQIARAPAPAPISEADVPKLVDFLLTLVPAMTAVTATAALIFNLWIAGRITLASGRLQRPWPDIARMTFPRGTPLALAASTAASFLDGAPGMIAGALSGALLLAFVLLGLAVLHYATRGLAWRSFALWLLYLALLFLNPVFLLVAAIGLVDHVWPLRRDPPS